MQVSGGQWSSTLVVTVALQYTKVHERMKVVLKCAQPLHWGC